MSIAEDPTHRLRERMVAGQIRARGILDERLLEVMARVPRHLFVPEARPEVVYADAPHTIGHRQTISQPYMVALMTELLEVRDGESVLEIGTGSGYQTAILAALGARVFTIERIPGLSRRARETLEALGYGGVRFDVGDGTLGWPEEAPFDRIVVTAGAREDPRTLAEQLAPEGILLVPVGVTGAQELISLRRVGSTIVRRTHCHCAFVRLIGREGWPEETR